MHLRVPDFVCIGAQKAGTTWLYNNLVSHAAISIPEKECNILTAEDAVLTRYTTFYENSCESAQLGDVSPFYATRVTAARRLADIHPNCKIIMLIREPVSRAFSQYRMATAAHRISPEISFWIAFRKNLGFMKRRGCYLDIINEYRAAGFGDENVLLLPFEWIASNPEALLEKVYDYLSVGHKVRPLLMGKAFASSTGSATMPENDRRRIHAWYAKRNRGLIKHLWWEPDWA